MPDLVTTFGGGVPSLPSWWRHAGSQQQHGTTVSAFISSGSGSSILGWIPIRIQGFNDQQLDKFTVEKKNKFTEVTKEANSQKENIQHFKTWIFQKKIYFCGSFMPSWIRIRIQLWSGSATLLPSMIRYLHTPNLDNLFSKRRKITLIRYFTSFLVSIYKIKHLWNRERHTRALKINKPR